jgi:hypothetical protein
MSVSRSASLAQFRRMLAEQMPFLRQNYHVETLGIFGSYVRNEQGPTSDLDVLVTFSQPPGLLQFVKLENYLSDLLGVKVDLVMREALKPHLGQRILAEVVGI